jgi:membrane protein
LSFYTLLSFAPLTVLAVWVTSALGSGAQVALLDQIAMLAGNDGREAAEAVIESAEEQPSLGSFAGIAGIVVSLVGATTVFAQLQSALNLIWDIEVQRKNAIWSWLRARILSIGVIAAVGFVMIVSLVMSALIGVFLNQTGLIWEFFNQVISALVLGGLFMLLFRYLPDSRLPWRYAIRGGVVTAILFSIGKSLIGLYLSRAEIGGAYGAAGSLVLLLVWVYYSGAIFFFGAEFIQAWVRAQGERIPSADHGEKKHPAQDA